MRKIMTLSKSWKRWLPSMRTLKVATAFLFLIYATSMHSIIVHRTRQLDGSNTEDLIENPYYRNATTSKPRIRQISILGERNSGTNWIHDHIHECFGHSVYVKPYLTRYKHWFQNVNASRYTLRYDTLVLAMFRNPYDWLEAMRYHPHHSPEHIHLDWDEFLAKPWTMERIGLDLNASSETPCQENFRYEEIISCVRRPVSPELYTRKMIESEDKPFYEMKQDGSGEPFANILELRAAKIRNFLETKNYPNVADLWRLHYEFLLKRGTQHLLDKISSFTGIPHRCNATLPQNRRQRGTSKRFVTYVNEHLDWTAEKLIGYYMS